LRGISPEHEKTVSELVTKMDQGSIDDLKAGEFGIVLGYDLALQLNVGIGDKVTVVAPKGKITPAGLLPRLKRFTVVAIFRLNMYEYDSGLALLHIDDASRLLQLDGSVNGLRLKLDEVYRAPVVRNQLFQQFGIDYRIRDWTQEHANFFNALVIEKRVMFIILFLIVLVAAFNIVSTLVMAVTDKQADIAILRTLGITRLSVMKIFVIQGSILGVLGTIIGGVLGILLALNVETIIPYVENKLGLEFFPANIYVISDFPAEMRWPDVTRTIIGAFIISVLSTIYPAWRASRVQPADALRYE
jgi:lipoprotein-releasing system permease protein